MSSYRKPSIEEFDVKENEVTHKPTNATWSAYPGAKEPSHERLSSLGSVLANGDDYRIGEVRAMALKLLAGRPLK